MSDLFQGDNLEADIPDTVTLADLVGDDKKYKTEADLAKAVLHKDQFIKRLERENAEAREALAKQRNEAEFLDKLEQVVKAKPPVEEPPIPERGNEQPAAVKPEDVDAIIERRLAEREAKRTRDANLKEVETKLRDVYGDDFARHVRAQAQTLGVGTEFLTDVAAKNPQALYRLLGLDGPARRQDDPAPPRSQFNSQPSSVAGGKKDWAYWQSEWKKQGDHWYFRKDVQKQIWDSVQSMGEAEFYARK